MEELRSKNTEETHEQLRDKRLAEIEPITDHHVEVESRYDLVKIIEGPLLSTCQKFYDKNIRTYMSSANKSQSKAEISIIYDSLSEKNQMIAEQMIIDESIAEFIPKNEVSGARLQFSMPVNANTTWGEVEDYFEKIADRFVLQRLIPDTFSPDFLMNYLHTAIEEDVPNGEDVTPQYFERHGYFYDLDSGVFFKGKSDRDRVLRSIKMEQNEELDSILSEINSDTETWVNKLEEWCFKNINNSDINLSEKIETALNNLNDKSKTLEKISYLYASKELRLKEVGKQQIRKILETYEIDTDSALEYWKADGPWLPFAIEYNIKKILQIEAKVEEQNKDREIKRENVTSFLQKECFISDFRRYPTDMLIRQYDEYFNSELDYGIIVFPKSDSAAAMGDYTTMLDDLDKQAKEQKIALRIFECKDKLDIVKALLKTKRYQKNGGHKISFGVLAAHGNESAINLGSMQGKHYQAKDMITWSDFLDERATKFKDFFEDDATIILSPCSAGKDKDRGVAKTFSESTGLHTLAPDNGSKTDKINVERDISGKIKVDVQFAFSNKVSFKKGVVE